MYVLSKLKTLLGKQQQARQAQQRKGPFTLGKSLQEELVEAEKKQNFSLCLDTKGKLFFFVTRFLKIVNFIQLLRMRLQVFCINKTVHFKESLVTFVKLNAW